MATNSIINQLKAMLHSFQTLSDFLQHFDGEDTNVLSIKLQLLEEQYSKAQTLLSELVSI